MVGKLHHTTEVPSYWTSSSSMRNVEGVRDTRGREEAIERQRGEKKEEEKEDEDHDDTDRSTTSECFSFCLSSIQISATFINICAYIHT